MAFRFRKSFKLAPGIRMNLSGRGLGVSVGPRGASVNFGKHGTFINVGIPGVGITSREKISGSERVRKSQSSTSASEVAVVLDISDGGTISFNDQYAEPLTEKLVSSIKRQHGEVIRNLIQKKCEEINEKIESVGEIHLRTPSPHTTPLYVPQAFSEAEPERPLKKRLGFFWSLFRSHRKRLKIENSNALAAYNQCLAEWQKRRVNFLADEEQKKVLIDVGIYSNIKDMEIFLENELLGIVWPRETLVSTEIFDEGRLVFIDVDFPELEDMPTKKAAVPSKGYKLSIKEMSSTAVQKLYMQHIHAIAFRILGEVFHALPKSEQVVFSGFSQATGQVSDEYLISVRVRRSAWENIEFSNLKSIDVTVALEAYELRRDMTKTGIFTPINPFSFEDQCTASVANA